MADDHLSIAPSTVRSKPARSMTGTVRQRTTPPPGSDNPDGRPPTKRARKAINCEPCRNSKLKCDRQVSCPFFTIQLTSSQKPPLLFLCPQRSVSQFRLPSAHPDLPNRYLCHVLPGWQGPRRRLCSHRRRPVSLVSSTCLCLMSPDTPVSTLHKKSLAFAILSLSSKPTYIPTSVLPSVVQQTLSAPCLQRRNSWTLIRNPHLQLSLAPRPLEASTQDPPVLLPTSRWFVLPPYGLSNPHLILSKGP